MPGLVPGIHALAVYPKKDVDGRDSQNRPRNSAAASCGKQIAQQVASALISRADVGGDGFHHDVVDPRWNLRIARSVAAKPARPLISFSRSAGAGVLYGSTPVSIWYIVTPSE